MGDFLEISHRHSVRNTIKINFAFKDISNNQPRDYKIDTKWETNKKTKLPLLKALSYKDNNTTFDIRKEQKKYIFNFEYNPTNDLEHSNPTWLAIQEFVKKISAQDPEDKNDTTSKPRKTQLERMEEYRKPLKIEDFVFDNIEDLRTAFYVFDSQRVEQTQSYISRIFNQYSQNANLISSFRLHPDRTYLEKSKDAIMVDKFGEGYLDQIILWENKNQKRFKELISIMKEIKLFHDLKLNRIKGGRYEILIDIKNKGTSAPLFDVGFGISQFLPIIVGDMQLDDNSTFFIAEPEIHLHPNVQANFADYLCKQIDKKNKNYVIETHSEYFLNRVRLAIVKGTLKETDLAIYYLENNADDTTIHRLKFGKRGQIENAPQEFFDTYLMDVKDIALNVE